MHITFNKDFRVFKKDDKIDFPVEPFKINWIVGDNRSGKSTILKLFRKQKDSLKDVLNKLRDGLYAQDSDIEDTSDIATIDGIDKYEKMFFLDAISDDPTNFVNSSTAGAFIGYGGLEAQKMSKGQKAAAMLGQFMQLVKDELTPDVYQTVMDRLKNSGDIDNCCVALICFDEVDEGMDLNAQMTFLKVLHKIPIVYCSDIIVVTHSLMLPILDCAETVFDMKTRSSVSVDDYISRLTGKHITIKVEDEEKVH
jgi:predicted ATPase